MNEVRAYLAYRRLDQPLAFWRTSSGFEVDLVIGDLDVALEFKASRRVRDGDLKGLRALLDEQRPRCALLVSREEVPQKTEDGIDILPRPIFCETLWGGAVTGI